MATLQIRNVPAEVKEKIRRIAARERRSVNAQVLIWLSEAVKEGQSQAAVDDLLEDARRIRQSAKRRKGLPDSLRLIKQAREARS